MSTTTYQIDPAHSAAHFSVRHLTIANIRGSFGKVSGAVEFDPSNAAASRVEATIDIASLSTGDPQRDGHLKAADFLDAEKFPSMTFHSKKVVSAGANSFTVVGDLTLHGVTKEATVSVEGLQAEVKDPWGNMRLGALAKARVSRKDFGLVWNVAIEAGGVMISDEVEVTIDAELMRKP